jgi:hypothetical protein
MGATVSTESNIQQHFLEFDNIIGGKIIIIGAFIILFD